MTTASITIRVDPTVARAFDAAPEEDRRKIQLLLGLRLGDLTASDAKPLSVIMDQLGANAKNNGLTQEILDTLLNED